MRSQARIWFLTLVCGVLLAALVAPAAQAAEEAGLENFVAVNCKFTHEGCASKEKTVKFKEAIGEPNGKILEETFGPQTYSEPETPTKTTSETEGFTQAGGRVPYGVTDFEVKATGSLPFRKPLSKTEFIRTDVAPGLATNPTAVATCSTKEFDGGIEGEVFPGSTLGFYAKPLCNEEEGKPQDTKVGEQKATVYLEEAGVDLGLKGPAFNLVPEKGRASEFGVAVELPKAVSAGGLKKFFEFLENAGLPHPSPSEQKTAEEGTYYAHTLIKGNVEWGKQPRGTNQGDFHDYFEIEVSTALPLLASRLVFYGTAGKGDFITNATRCENEANQITQLKLRDKEKGTAEGKYKTLIGINGCGSLEFKPGFAFTPATTVTEQPNEFTATASETHNPAANDASQVKSASFTLPEGMTLNPSAAAGLTACTEAQAHQEGTVFGEAFGVECPASSKIGTVTLEVPTLPPGSLTGNVYLGAPNSGTITGPPYKIYVVANSERYGVSVRLLGETIPNSVTGQVNTYFKNPPEQPFNSLALHFERGVLTPVANPLLCGNPQGVADFEPTSKPGVVTGDAFGQSITGCASTPPPFNPAQSTANSNGNAGASTQFTFNLARNDGEQYVGSVKTVLPPGLVGKIPAAERCSAAAAESETVACPAGSQIGTATVQAGSGPQPFTFTGPVYLTNSVKGAPYGLSIKVPAVAGPFNLGNVVTVATVNVTPMTAQVVVETTLPKIRSGIPLRVKTIKVSVTKSGFMLNPTNCGKLETVSTVGGFATLAPGGATATKGLSSPFQVGNCSALKFKPKFGASTSSRTSRTSGAALTTTMTMPSGQANIKSVKVQLPRNLPSRLTTLQKACTEQLFNANPYFCKRTAWVGEAIVKTPTLPTVLKGPAILVSHAGASFPDLDLVLEDQNHLRVILVGNTNIKNGITTTTFATTPDVPASSVTVKLPRQSNSALGAFGGLCAKPLVMPTTIVSQTGKTFKQNTIINVSGCGVQVVGRKVVGSVLYLTVRAPEAGRISAGGNGLVRVFRRARKAHQLLSLKVPLSGAGRGRGRPFSVNVRLGFVPKHGHNKVSFTRVTFR